MTATAMADHQFGGHRLADEGGQDWGNPPALETDELATTPMDQGSVFSQHPLLTRTEPPLPHGHDREFGILGLSVPSHPVDSGTKPRACRNAEYDLSTNLAGIGGTLFAQVTDQLRVLMVRDDPEGHLPQRAQNIGSELSLKRLSSLGWA
jgi:hypothetical protein